MTSSNTAGAGAAPSSASTLGLLPFTVAYLDAICSSPSASDSIAASAQPEGQTLPAPQRMPPSLGLSRTEGYILNHLTMPRSISYTDRSLSEDAASHQHLFPLKRPPNVQVVRRALTVPDVIFNMNPSALIAYTVPHSPNASNVWPDKRPDNSPTAAYIAYPLPRKMLDMEEPTSSLVDFIWTDCREQPHLNAPPMYPTTTAATADAAKGPAYDRLPQEMWNAILKHLAHDDLKALRLTCRRLNQSTTKALFDTVVVPFRPGMFSEELRAELENHSGKGKGRSTAINIFKSHGHHIKKFGLSYEVTEARLAHLPKLVQHDLLESYWGTYYWPSSPVHQPDDMPASVMEEIVGMKDAFSDMPSLKELALSIDNGLGWLPGPDKSIRSQIIQDRIQLFPNRNGLPTRSRQAQQELWDFVKSQYKDQDKSFELSQAHLFRVERMGGRCDLPGPYTGIPRDLQHIDRRILLEATTPEGHPTDISSNDGFLVVAPDNWTRSCTSHPVQPSNLTEEQLEMLLKTQWAQDSLIDSYIIGVIDSETCRRVTALNLACLPARCVPFFDRADFWDALPCLEFLKLMIMGEIREMDKDFFGNASSISAMPLKGIQPFRTLLVNHIAERSNIKNLTIGWVGGGEHASGMLGRNRHILPAPFMDVRTAASPYMMDDVNIFPHIEHLTLNNCWMTPRALDCLVDGHRQSKLRKLTLDSVSLQLLPVGAGGQMPTAGFRIPNPIPGRPDMVFPQREGSWPYVLDGISPGAHFGHFNGGTRNHRSKSSLKEIELISCGYSVLEATNAWSIESMDREFLDANNAAAIPDANAFPNSRRAVLESVMAKVRDVHLGTIVQHIPQVEADILEAMWGATLGWSDLDSRHAVALDGLRDGGTGRFSAVIRAPDLG